MPKINNIAVDQVVEKNDKLLGSDAGGGTRNYRIEDIAGFIRDTNAAGVVNQFSYIFYNSSFGGSSTRPSGSMTIDTGDAAVAFSSVTTIKISNKTYRENTTLDNAISDFTGKYMVIANNKDRDKFGVYTCTAVTQDPVETSFYDLTLSYTGGNGNLEVEEIYSIATAPAAEESDTLDSVTDRNNTTTNTINVGGATSDYFALDTTATPTLQPGMLSWNDAFGTADLRLKGDNVTLQLGQETVARVVNKTGANLLESEYKVVRVRIASEGGAQGKRLAVVLAQGDNDPDSVTTLGVVTEDIANNEEGFITVFGNVSEINTTGTLQGETWVDGDVLYLSPTTPGGLTKVKPTAPDHTVTMGYVVYAHQNHGKIFVKVDNGYEIDELHNVSITNPQDEDILLYNSASSIWENTPLASAVPTPTLQTVTDAGNTATNDITVNGLDVDAGSGTARIDLITTNDFGRWFYIQTDGQTARIDGQDSLVIGSDNGTARIWINASGSDYMSFYTNNVESFRVSPSQNVLIGTTTDAGYKLDVNGTSIFRDKVSIAADTTATTQTTSVIQATDTNSGIAIVPNGTGAITRLVPDGTATGGIARGQYAVDFGIPNNGGGKVASGNYSYNHGYRNTASGDFSFSFGRECTASGVGAIVMSSYQNNATRLNSTAIGGSQNNATSDRSTVIGGQSNTASTNTYATVVGGYQNSSTGQYSVSGGSGNTASALGTVALGINNTASANYAIALGRESNASGSQSVAIGYTANATGNTAVVIGDTTASGERSGAFAGFRGNAEASYSVVIGGDMNSSRASYSVVIGGTSNQTNRPRSVVVGGSNNTTYGDYGVTLGGQYNTMGNSSTNGVSMGERARADHYSSFTQSSGMFSSTGDAQQSTLVSRKEDTLITGATTTLSLDGTGTTNLMIPYGTNRVWNVQVKTVATITSITGTATGVSVGDSLMQDDKILFSKIGGTSSVVGTNAQDFISSSSLSTASMSYSAGASQELALTFTAPTFTGGGSVTMRVVSKVELVEVAY